MAKAPARSLCFPVITRIRLSHFSLYTLEDPIEFSFDAGILCLAGANGLGKSTFLQVLNYGLTGVAFKPNQKFVSVDDYRRDIIGFTEDYFEGRISPEHKEISEIELDLLFGTTRVVVQRGFVEPNELRGLTVYEGDELTEYAHSSPEQRHRAYEDLVVKKSGLSSFNEFVFVQSFVLTFDERRHLLFWDPKVLETCLLIFVGVDKEQRTEVERLRRQMERADSRVRNLVYDIKQVRDRLADLDVIAISQEGSREDTKTYSEFEAMRERAERVGEEVGAIEAKILDAKLAIAESSARASSLRSSYKAEFAARLNAKKSAHNHPIVKSSILEGKCAICGAEGDHVANHINAALRNYKCPLCGSEENQGNESPEFIERLKDLDRRLAVERQTIDSSSLLITQLEGTREKRASERDELNKELREFEEEHNDVVARASAGVGDLDKLRQVYQENIASVSRERDKQREFRKKVAGEYRQAQKQLEQQFLDVRDRFVPAFNSLAYLFLGVPLDILLESREKSLTLAIEIKGTRRRGAHELAESQRFFIDIALRMAFAQFASAKDWQAPLYIDTPEGSLDLAYESQAGKMIARFANQKHRVFMTANVNTSQLLRSIASHSKASGFAIQRLYRWTELSEIQEPQEKNFDRTLNELERLARSKKK